MTPIITILIIDDSEDDRMFYRRMLKHQTTEAQFLILEADDGKTGLQIVAQKNPACILLDYSMPGDDGVEILKLIRSTYPFIPVVMLTGQGNESIAVAAINEGAQNYISKATITSESLAHAINVAIEHCTLQKRIHEQRISLEVFTRALAHDLKEPLRTIRSFSDLIMQSETLTLEGENYFQHVVRAAERMQMLIETVFLYTRLEDPNQMPKQKCDANTTLKEVEENLKLLIQENHTAITSDLLPEVYANQVQLMQLFQNLISNAIRHNQKNIAIHIQAKKQADSWLFEVADNGQGIAKEFQKRIFEPFNRLNRSEEGAGLGLAICKKIVEMNGGKIWCESKGEGALFAFTLPILIPEEKKNTITPIQVPAHSPALLSSLSLANILLVDDRDADIELMQYQLIRKPRLDCHLFVAHDGQEALELLKSGNPPIDVLLLDINMPRMNGFELLEYMQHEKELKDITVIMCSGSTYDKDIDKASDLGAAGYLVKPGQFDALKSIFERTAGLTFNQGNGTCALLRGNDLNSHH